MKHKIVRAIALLFLTLPIAALGMQKQGNLHIHNFVQDVVNNLNNPAKRAESKIRRIQKKHVLAQQNQQPEKLVTDPCPICREERNDYPTFLIHIAGTKGIKHWCHAHCWYAWLSSNGNLTGDNTAETIETACILCMEKVTFSRDALEQHFMVYVKKGLKGLALKLLTLPTLSPGLAKCVVQEYENATSEQRQYVSEMLWKKLVGAPQKCAEIFGNIIQCATPHHTGKLYIELFELFGILGDKALDACTRTLATKLQSGPDLIKTIAGFTMIPEYINGSGQLLEGATARLYFYLIWHNKPLFATLLPPLKIAALHRIMEQPYSTNFKQRCFRHIIKQLESKKQQALLIERYMGEFSEEFIDDLAGEIGLER